MIYLKHNFFSNFAKSVQAGDNEMLCDIVINELSNLIVYHKDKVVELYEKVKIPIKANATTKVIAEKLVSNLPKNIMLTKGLAFLIGETNDSVTAKKKDDTSQKKQLNQNSKKKIDEKIEEAELSTNWKENVAKIQEGIETIARNLKEKPQTQILFKDKLIKSINIKLESLGKDEERIGNKETDNTFIILLTLLGIGVAVYFLSKQKTIETITETITETATE